MTVPIASAPGKADADKLTILKLLAGGRDADFVAQAVGTSRDDVVLVATAHGYPDVQKMAWAVDVLTKQIDEEHATSGPAARANGGLVARPGTRPAPVPARPGERPGEPTPTVAALIAQGNKSERAATRRLAEKVADLLERLDAAVRVEQAERREAAERAAAEAKVRSEIARLEAELAAKRALLPKHAASLKGLATVNAGVDPKTVRAWARENGVACNSAGRVPRAVVDAYLTARAGAS